jgi:hypothetical protein
MIFLLITNIISVLPYNRLSPGRMVLLHAHKSLDGQWMTSLDLQTQAMPEIKRKMAYDK